MVGRHRATAAQAAAILGRPSVNPHGRRAAELIRRVAQERGVDWLVDLAHRIAARFRQDTWVGRWHFVATLLHAEGGAPPTDDRCVQLWLTAVESPDRFHQGQPAPVVDRLRDDPFLATMLPRLFEVDGIGVQMMFVAAHENWNDPGRPALPAPWPSSPPKTWSTGRCCSTVRSAGCCAATDPPRCAPSPPCSTSSRRPPPRSPPGSPTTCGCSSTPPRRWPPWPRRRCGSCPNWSWSRSSTPPGRCSPDPTRHLSGPSSPGSTNSPAGTGTGPPRSPR
ncbi:hypothetical protein [Verrucosispora sioxanthis]|uniref:hypothetical protein n=1 Tax=Verrucosispora sioxanthis TaxID=2499994 RepID=UPI001C12842B|nr:hypothetical protein [Verrucosispora sioxanthis]